MFCVFLLMIHTRVGVAPSPASAPAARDDSTDVENGLPSTATEGSAPPLPRLPNLETRELLRDDPSEKSDFEPRKQASLVKYSLPMRDVEQAKFVISWSS